jgi:hypothetical protein
MKNLLKIIAFALAATLLAAPFGGVAFGMDKTLMPMIVRIKNYQQEYDKIWIPLTQAIDEKSQTKAILVAQNIHSKNIVNIARIQTFIFTPRFDWYDLTKLIQLGTPDMAFRIAQTITQDTIDQINSNTIAKLLEVGRTPVKKILAPLLIESYFKLKGRPHDSSHTDIIL